MSLSKDNLRRATLRRCPEEGANAQGNDGALPSGKILASFLVASLYLFHFFCLRPNLVNIPYYDEWEGMGPERIPENLSLDYLRMQHNEHRIFWTRLQMWLFYKFTGWNVVLQQESNFLIFGLLLLALYWFSRRMLPQLSPLYSLGALTFFIAPRNYENHFWGFQSQFHCVLLFFVLTITLLFDPQQRRSQLIGGLLCLVATMYSFSAGVPLTTLITIGYVACSVYRYISAPKPRSLGQLGSAAAVLAVYGASLFSWFFDYRPFTGHPAFVYPYKREFWLFLANFIAHGFGIDRVDRVGSGIAVLLLLSSLAPICWWALRGKGRGEIQNWAIMTALGSVFGAASIIAMGRAGFNYSFMAKSSRYAEIANLFIPFVVLAWAVVLRERAKIKELVLCALIGVAFIAHLDNWNFNAVYAEQRAKRLEVLQCALDYYQHRNDGFCPLLYPFPLADRLDRAREARLSFYRKYVEAN